MPSDCSLIALSRLSRYARVRQALALGREGRSRRSVTLLSSWIAVVRSTRGSRSAPAAHRRHAVAGLHRDHRDVAEIGAVSSITGALITARSDWSATRGGRTEVLISKARTEARLTLDSRTRPRCRCGACGRELEDDWVTGTSPIEALSPSIDDHGVRREATHVFR